MTDREHKIFNDLTDIINDYTLDIINDNTLKPEEKVIDRSNRRLVDFMMFTRTLKEFNDLVQKHPMVIRLNPSVGREIDGMVKANSSQGIFSVVSDLKGSGDTNE